ncbi:MAG: BsuPI-related putative proteinase inhibitor [Verrucomicrobiae bacterium]|nr:BsuPI-related putative proteinase inhibitor [Verrucomicrobiae bacterium]
MKKTLLIALLSLWPHFLLQATDVMPSKEQGSAREKNDAAGAGDGFLSGIMGGGNEETRNKRLDKVNKIKREDFELKLELAAPSVSRSAEVQDAKFFIQPFLKIQNKSKLIRTLNFPNGQKYDFIIFDKSGREITRWSEGRTFATALGSTLINPGEFVRFTETIPLTIRNERLPAGEYVVVGELKGYPEFSEKIAFSVIP